LTLFDKLEETTFYWVPYGFKILADFY